jgi:hypothetical protein
MAFKTIGDETSPASRLLEARAYDGMTGSRDTDLFRLGFRIATFSKALGLAMICRHRTKSMTFPVEQMKERLMEDVTGE